MREAPPGRYRRLIAVLVMAGGLAMPAAVEAKPLGKPGLGRSKAATQAKPSGRQFRPRYYRRLQPDAVRRVLSGEHPKSQVAPQAIPGR